LVKVPRQDLGLEEWWNQPLQGLPKKVKQSLASILI
jgi:hypothetical protein